MQLYCPEDRVSRFPRSVGSTVPNYTASLHRVTAVLCSLDLLMFKHYFFCDVQRTDTNRLPKQALQYKPKGRRNIGRPRKRWRDQFHLEDQ